jgi:hypothetical protein
MAQLLNTTLPSTGFLQLPRGTTAERPGSPVSGMIRYNTTINDTEYYDGSAWRVISDSHPEATGGTIVDTEIGGVPYRIHLFTTVGSTNFVVSKGGEIEYLIVAGGGSGGSGRHAGGGGAGGLLTGIATVTPQTYAMVVGDGGTAAASNGDGAVGNGNNGGNSSGFGLTAVGGGRGGGHPGPTESGAAGGSGGGAGHSGTGGAGTAGQGNAGTGVANRAVCGAGGGAGGSPISGFGAEGDFSGQGDIGGVGIYSTILPPGFYFAGGGGGSGSPNDGSGDLWVGGHGGAGGGGGGASSTRAAGSAGGVGGHGLNRGGNGAREIRTGATGFCNGGSGGANTGGGGGGAGGWGSIGNGRGGNGGSGVVIVRYRRNLSSVTAPTYIRRGILGATPNNPARSALEIMRNNGEVPDGVYYIDLPGVGPTATFCLMNTAFKGGGWMLALKATRGSTFNYDSNYWTTNNTLNPTSLDLLDRDAKFESFNRFPATEIMARFPDVQNGGTMENLGGWIWDERLPNSPSSLSTFFANCPQTRLLESDEIFNWRGHRNSGPFSAQSVWRKYGFNLTSGNGRQRWGFQWNENAVDDPTSQDVAGGIGVSGLASFSAGDQINCCQSYAGVNRTMRLELYVR